MRKEAKTRVLAALGWGVLLGALTVPGIGRAEDGKEACRDCVQPHGTPLFSRIPYLNRLFTNTGVGSCPLCCDADPKCGEDSNVERIGIDFDFVIEDTPEAVFGIKVVEFCPVAGTCSRATACVSKANAQFSNCEDGTCDDADCLADGDDDLRTHLLNLSIQAAVLENMSELREELVAARLEMSEKLAQAKVEHFEALLQLAVENSQLKAKLEFQTERDNLQAQIVELTMENAGLKTQTAVKEQILEAQLAVQFVRQEAEQLAKEKERLEARVADLEGKTRESDASSSEASVANKRRGGTSRK